MRRFFQNFFLNFVKITGYIPFLLYLKPHIYYEKKDTPKVSGAEIAVANHTTLIDFVMLMFVYKFRVVRVLMAEVLFKKPLCAWFMRNIRGIKVNRSDDTGVEHMHEMKQTLYDQDVVAIFPEGRINKQGRDYGELLPISNGAIHLAMTTGACIRPMYFHTNGGFFKSSAILVGDPVNIQEKFGSDPTPEALRKARSYLTMRLETLRDDLKLRDAHRYNSLLSRHIRWSMGVLLRCAFGINFHYTDKTVQAHKLKRNAIIVSNHSSIYDPPMICTLFPKDRVHIIACETLYKNKWLALLLNRVGSIKIDRTCLDMESFHAINDVLSKGHNVGIFPEGAMFEDGQIHEFKSSFVISALNAGVEVLPVYIGGEYKMFSKKLDIVIDVPMKLEVEALTVEEIEAQAKRVRDRLCYLKETLENRS